MNLDRDASTTDEYLMTALQIFDYCGAENGGTLRVDALMDKFAPFVKTNKAEYGYLKSLLDPEQSNPEINVTRLAQALSMYSESQKSKVDFDESFNNSKSGPMPQDSDSGISADAGYQLLEELQSELREKSHLALQLRSQLDYTDRQHEEALQTMQAERDSLRAHLNMLREENITLTHVRNDYEEACERLCASEQALSEARRDLDSSRRRNKQLLEQVSAFETEQATLQELLAKSKEECHRINEMYLSRQSALREQNEALRAEHAELRARLHDHADYMQQLIKEKVVLEMELKEMVNKSNQSQLCLNRSVDISFTEDQMLTALDPLNADSRFASENKILDEEAFVNALREEQGRATNMSLFDEIRLSLSNISRHSVIEMNETQCANCDILDNSFVTIGTQTDEGFNDNDVFNCHKCIEARTFELDSNFDTRDENELNSNNFESRNQEITLQKSKIIVTVDKSIQTEKYNAIISNDRSIQTEEQNSCSIDNNNCGDYSKCFQCNQLNNEMHSEFDKYEDSLNKLEKCLGDGDNRNSFLQTMVSSLQEKIDFLEEIVADQKIKIDSLTYDSCCVESQTLDGEQATVSTQAELPCADCEKRKVAPQRGLRRYLWEPLKSLFQVFAVVLFVGALSILYGVTRRAGPRCVRDAAPVPWRWLDAQEFMDLLLRIEYVADVPM